jgi:hypothetical protein
VDRLDSEVVAIVIAAAIAATNTKDPSGRGASSAPVRRRAKRKTAESAARTEIATSAVAGTDIPTAADLSLRRSSIAAVASIQTSIKSRTK